jgi:hypothetical protein
MDMLKMLKEKQKPKGRLFRDLSRVNYKNKQYKQINRLM